MSNSYFRFKISLLQQLLLLIPFIGSVIAITIGYYYIFGFATFDYFQIIYIIFLFLFLVLPVLLLHIQYLFINGGNVLVLDLDKRVITLEQGGTIKQYSIKDINTLKYYATGGHISTKGSSLNYTFDPYRFYKITFEDKNEMIITCLMINNIENTLENLLGIKAERIFRLVPLVY